MRGVILHDEVRESDIRPRELFERYVQLLERDVRAMFRRRRLVEVACPGCGRQRGERAFTRFGLTYRECPQCLTMYLSPRPTPEALASYYAQSRAVQFWERVLLATEPQRREHVVQHRVDWLADVVGEFLPEPRVLVDWEGKSTGFIEQVRHLRLVGSVQAVAPSREVLDYCRRTGIRVVEPSAVPGGASVVTAFEAVERAFDPQDALRRMHGALVEEGLLLLTTRTASGFDVQVLWDRAPNVLPPTHMNLFSVEALQSLLERLGFVVVELSTPGQLDVEIVRNALATEPAAPLSRFVSYMLRHRGGDAHQALQELLQRFRLSSHLRAVCVKRTAAAR